MNKSMKKVIALITSAVLCCGMGTTVLAAENPSVTDPVIEDGTSDTPSVTDPAVDEGTTGETGTTVDDTTVDDTAADDTIQEVFFGSGLDKDGNKVTVFSEGISEEVEATLKDESAVKDILKDAGYEVNHDHKIVVLGAGDYSTYDARGNKIDQDLSDGAEMRFSLGSSSEWYTSSNWDDLKDIKDGDIIYVLHQTADGTWEVIEGKAEVVSEYGYTQVSVTATMTGFSPVAFIKVMSDGKVAVLDKAETKVAEVETAKSGSTVKAATETVKTSPKTGEW